MQNPTSIRKVYNGFRSSSPIKPDDTEESNTSKKEALGKSSALGEDSKGSPSKELRERTVETKDSIPLEVITAIEAYTEKALALRGLENKARLVKDITSRCNALKEGAKAYLNYYQALDPIHLPSCLKEKLSNSLEEILEEDLLPLYVKGYIKAEWFQDYKPHLHTLLDSKNNKALLKTLINLSLKEDYGIPGLDNLGSQLEQSSFEAKAERLIREQFQFLILFLQDQEDHLQPHLSLIEELLEDLNLNHLKELGFHSIANVAIFLIRHGKTSSIECFLKAYQHLYTTLKPQSFAIFRVGISLKSSLCLCIGWKRFFSLHKTHILELRSLFLKDILPSEPLMNLYFESLVAFQDTSRDCFKAIQEEIEKEGNRFLSWDSSMADLVSCLSILLQVVRVWSDEVLGALGTMGPNIQEKARALKELICQKCEKRLKTITCYYPRTFKPDDQTADAIQDFLRTGAV